MKATFALGALAALSQSAFSLREGTYMIGSPALDPSLVLGETRTDGGPLEFAPRNGHPGQTWFLQLSGSSNRDFFVNNTLGGYINCGTEEGSLCFAGEEPQIYTLESAGDNKYEFVSQGSSYFLRVNEQRVLQLAAWDQSPNEQFTLTSS
ncbi:hypothetical protein N7532_005547 [Penicillium argentinense]|uniref:Uncharacterized protein n=1 Tax=Penicillium argentinense TaxID=1131581 RepID=A0A9W9FEA8_9EURO|nr:uncharacterized protein N7532_005547 [Penicillium argentinense]KAJ5098546.1 hypothetical protein N7532_005547 [Penicillium argentinense]